MSAARVGLFAALVMAACYVAIVTALDLAVAERLTAQVDRQLAARLQVASTSPADAFSSSGVQTNGARYGLGIYGEPIALWKLTAKGRILRAAPGDPVLPATVRPPGPRGPRAVNQAIASTTYRFRYVRAGDDWLLAAESLTELGHVEAVLILAEAVVFPVLLAAFFLAALAIGLKSSRPVEMARRRQLEFTADASHELRTPLSVIEAEVSLAASQPRTAEEYREALGRVGEETKRLGRIVEDLLWLARADSRPPASDSRVDLAEVARRCAERFGPVALSRGQRIELVVPGPGGPDLTVVGPADWVDELAGTVTENACRYSPEGALVRVSALALADGERPALRIEDSGPGIDDSEQEEVVRRFHRATAEPGGHGLGLAIADSVVRGTGGRLHIGRSDLGGALVEASWPRQRQRGRPGAPEQPGGTGREGGEHRAGARPSEPAGPAPGPRLPADEAHLG